MCSNEMSNMLFYILRASLVLVLVCLPTQAKHYSCDAPGYCRINKMYIKEGGEHAGQIGDCTKIKCLNASPNRMKISSVGCVTLRPNSGCYISEYDNTQRYPNCCPQEICEDRPGYCKVGDVYIKEGEEDGGPIGQCIRIRCVSVAPNKTEVGGVGCATFQPSPGCTISDYDYTKRYPECCPKPVCHT